MVSKAQLTGMAGVYLAAAELTRRGFIVSPTSRSALAADLLVTDQRCKRTFSVQVKTNGRPASYWLIGNREHMAVSDTHIYVLVNLRKNHERARFFVVPSKVVRRRTRVFERPNSVWYAFFLKGAEGYEDAWEEFGDPESEK